MRWLATLFALAFCVTAAKAQDRITPDEFLDIAVGKTLTFEVPGIGIEVGREEFIDRNTSLWVQPDGRCVIGHITVEGPALCFSYEDQPENKQCWWPFRSEGRLMVRFARLFDADTQEVTKISNTLLSCLDRPTV